MLLDLADILKECNDYTLYISTTKIRDVGEPFLDLTSKTDGSHRNITKSEISHHKSAHMIS